MALPPQRDARLHEDGGNQQTETKVKEYSKAHHDKNVTERYFSNGDRVLVFSPVVDGKRSNKLADRWQ